MNKISFKGLSKKHYLLFFVFILLFSIVWGMISANDTSPTSNIVSPPTAPSNLTTGTIINSIPLSWTDNSSDEDKFKIERKASTSTDWTGVWSIILPANSNSYIDNEAQPGTAYDYRVQACLLDTCSDFTYLNGVMITSSPIPSAPTNLRATVSGNAVTLTWNDNSSNEGGFKIYRGPIWTDIGNVGANVTTFVDSNRAAGTYTYRLNAFTSGTPPIYSPISNDVSVTVGGGTPTDTTGGNVTNTQCSNLNLSLSGEKTSYTVGENVNYTWTCTPGVASNVSIFLQKPNGTLMPYNNSSGSATQTLGFSTANLVAGEYVLKACFDTACSTVNASKTFTVAAANTTEVPSTTSSPIPSAPTNLRATVNGNAVTLTWNDNSSNEGGFKIYRGPIWTDIGNVGANVTTFVDSNRGAGTYTYRLNAFTSSTPPIYSPISNDVSVTVGGGTPSDTTGGNVTNTQCTNLNLSLSGEKTSYTVGENVNYTWTCTPGVASNVSIFLQKPNGTLMPYNNSSGSATQTLGFSTTNLVAGEYVLKACFDTACSTVNASKTFTVAAANTTEVPSTTSSPIPSAPTNLRATVSGNAVTLTWNDNSSNEGGFKIYRGPIWTDIGNVGANVTTFVDSNRAAGTYTYRLNAFTSGTPPIYSPISNDVSVTVGGGGATTKTETVSSTPINNNTVVSGTNPVSDKTIQIEEKNITPNTFAKTDSVISTIVFPEVSPVIPDQNTTVPKTVTELTTKIENIGTIVEKQKVAIDDSKEKLVKIINENINSIVKNSDNKIDENKINSLKDKIIQNVDTSLATATTPTDISNLQTNISKSIDEIKTIAGTKESTAIVPMKKDISNTLSTLASTVAIQSTTLKSQGGDLLYKDSNNDGISDYDSVHVYNIDPIKPSPTSIYEGKTVNASEKILLGLDPTKTEIVKINKEEPAKSSASVVQTYKIKQIELTDKKEIIIKGQALPNSFITVYIYSTPVMVTIKTNSRGEWQYKLDKELEDGKHTIYTATVNNSGNIVAKSTGYLFTKTAEAVSIKDLPPTKVSDESKPELFSGKNLYAAIGIIGLLVLLMIILVIPAKKVN